MKGSFGGGTGMGGGPAAGGNMLRAVSRVVTRAGGSGGGVQESFSTKGNADSSSPTSPRTASRNPPKPNSKNHLSLSSPCNSPLAAPLCGSSDWPPSQYDDYFWVSGDGSEDEEKNVNFDEFLLGPVPSRDEVQNAVSAIQQVFDSTASSQFVRDKFGPSIDMDVDPLGLMHRASSTGSDLDWMEPAFHLSNPRPSPLYGYGSGRVLDAFHLLQTDPSVQRMVVSLSQDRAVWDAVRNNEVVRELRESCYAAETTSLSDETSEDGADDANPIMDVVRQMLDQTKARFMDVIEKITKLVNVLFKPLPHPSDATAAMSEPSDPFEEKLRASFMLSVLVLLIVVVGRSGKDCPP